jgi:hypothetical protein
MNAGRCLVKGATSFNPPYIIIRINQLYQHISVVVIKNKNNKKSKEFTLLYNYQRKSAEICIDQR